MNVQKGHTSFSLAPGCMTAKHSSLVRVNAEYVFFTVGTSSITYVLLYNERIRVCKKDKKKRRSWLLSLCSPSQYLYPPSLSLFLSLCLLSIFLSVYIHLTIKFPNNNTPSHTCNKRVYSQTLPYLHNKI